ncbi:DUF3343 domain-containing protein [Anaerococcus vaginalis]|uniref:DUF3343 domain-containing protein n=2 Tax=Anaerococcus vaginalis TaxID=33037 RepID=A0A7T4F0M3_9FIRM|nr:DUF3343 domain-containing protein [Anaerococcus vaginalis]EEU12044.1 hypothetical protein HMPREF0078_1340 [Anaerococcus vaginalis ATCC 51170]QQB61683.1 DUF3343 domain-containing protein [Anaerococcus vaginalis]
MEYVIYTFKSSNLAYLALSKVENENIRARLVPLLPEIDAGCGLCLRYEKNFDEKVKEIFSKYKLDFEEKYLLIYKENDRKPEVKAYDLS